MTPIASLSLNNGGLLSLSEERTLLRTRYVVKQFVYSREVSRSYYNEKDLALSDFKRKANLALDSLPA